MRNKPKRPTVACSVLHLQITKTYILKHTYSTNHKTKHTHTQTYSNILKRNQTCTYSNKNNKKMKKIK